ncbi:40773_t:CDS:2, partial [Gigaspora margarita]
AEHNSLFMENTGQLGRKSVIQYVILVEDSLLIKQRFYPTSKPEYEAANLTLNKTKYYFGQQKISYLGHEISMEGISPSGSKVKAQNSFEKLKENLMTAPILAYPNDDKKYILYTDTSYTALGAILAQIDNDKKEHFVEYASQSTSPAEKNYTITELEYMAIGWA